MKWAVAFVVAVTSTVATAQYAPYSLEQMNGVRVTGADCNRIDQVVDWAENQLRMRGILNVEPETLNSDDRLFNLRARSIIWALRVGCSNPNRYK